MRSILLHIADDHCLEAKTQVALDLARAFGGHMTCLQAVPYEYGVPGDFYGGFMADLIPVLREAAEKVRERCESRLAPEDVTWSWDHEDGPPAEHLLRRSALSDLVVLGSHEPFGRGPSTLAENIVLRGRTPIMLVPEHAKGLDCSGTALIAWNGSEEASRALKAAVPLLAKARSVVLASVTGEPDGRTDFPAVEGAEYLARHDIGCQMIEFPLGRGSVADVLAEAAAARDAAYVVMGAYGHFRIVEAALGGVTRRLFAKPPLPIFACH